MSTPEEIKLDLPHTTTRMEERFQLAYFCPDSYTPWSQPGGPSGPSGPVRNESPPTASPGTPGNIDKQTTATFVEIGQLTSPSHCSMMLQASTRDYLNQDFDGALQRLIWLKAILNSCLNAPPSPKTPPSDIDRYQTYSEKIDTLIRQLNLGLDYYAQPLNAVPLLSVDFYRALIKEMIGYGTDIQTAYLDYTAVQRDNNKAKEALATAMTKALLSIQNMQSQADQLLTQQQPLTDSIVRLGVSLNDVWQQLMSADANFKAAVASKGAGCDFKQIITICAAIGTLVMSGGTTAALIGTAISALEKQPLKYGDGKPVGDDFKGFEFKVNTVVAAGSGIGSFADAFNKVRGALKPKTGGVDALPSDEAKIVASADDVEAQLKPFLELPEAKNYDALIRSFVSVSQARNNKILEYNNLLGQWQGLNADIAQTQKEADAAQSAYALLQDPFVAEAQNFMAKAWIDSKTTIIRALYDIYRSYQYYSLNTAPLPINDFSIASLEAAQQNVLGLYAASKAAFGAAPSNMRLRIDLLPYIPKGSLAKFRTSGKVSVSLPPNQVDLSPYTNVRATRIGLEMRDAHGPPKRMQANIIHEGLALIFDASRRPHVFSHVAVPVPFEINNGKTVIDGSVAANERDGNSSDANDYDGLTPYGPWAIEINLATIDPGFLERMSQLTLVIEGKARGHV
jgi:hypothetical protein